MNLIKVLTVISLLVLGVTAQIKINGKTKPVVRTNATTAGKPAFTRERFDPKRDPAVDLASATLLAKSSGKNIIIDVGGEWCGWCVYMDRFFFDNPSVAKLRDDNYVWLKVNMGPENENKAFLSAYPEISGYPHLFVLDSDGILLQSQSTDVLEAGKGYDLKKFTEFLQKWVPKP